MYAKRIVLHFPRQLVDKPILCNLFKKYRLEFNILKASVTPDEEGLMVLELAGEKKDYTDALHYLEKEGVTIQRLSQDITRDDEKCVHCGACVPVCPTLAFTVDAKTRAVSFTQDKCIACEVCVAVCPYQAMRIKF